MRKTAFLFLILLAIACSSTATKTSNKPLYEVLTKQADGGANIRFYEILSEEREIKMLQADENLKRKIRSEDLMNSTFIILNMGEKNSMAYSIKIKNVEETADKIIVTVEDSGPQQDAPDTSEYFYPYTIVKINSKKPIFIQ